MDMTTNTKQIKKGESIMDAKMFCFQCQEAAKGSGCTVKGVCGKTDQVANLQDMLMYITKGVSVYADIGRKDSIVYNEADRFVLEALFITITNANFDQYSIIEKIKEGFFVRERLKKLLEENHIKLHDNLPENTKWFSDKDEEIISKSSIVGVLHAEDNEDVRSLKELLTYGIKGIAAYAEHAWNLGFKDDSIYGFIHKGLSATVNKNINEQELVNLVTECGKFGVDVMALLDKANTETYGNPEISNVNVGVRNNPAILISGHDLKDMEDLLVQTKNTGIDVYTHSEMLPANYYPAFKKYDHFVGNYGNSWWFQDKEFTSFNGPILMTTNCITPVKEAYKNRIYTTGMAGWPDATHIADRPENGTKDFSAVIAQAKTCAAPTEIESGTIVGGFAHAQVMALADKVVDAVKSGALKRFVVMAGCDGRQPGRHYFTEVAEALPNDTVILTAGCAKYRYNKLNLGDIGGIPRVLDAGQCNDSYSLAYIALQLKEVFGVEDINDLPISYDIAWYEQKAVVVLLALLALGVKHIRLGPTLPAFLSPNVAKVLVEKFDIKPTGDVAADVAAIMSGN